MSALAFLTAELERLRDAGLLRAPHTPPAGALTLCSNDYLGYARRAPRRVPAGDFGAGASRLVSGERPAHAALEQALARWVGCDACLAFSSGYAANVGTLACLAGRGDLVVSDELNHASIVDGCRLSRATVEVVPHCDLGAVERALAGAGSARRRFVVTESYFSMDGDGPDLGALRRLCDAHDAVLYVDEAHALGILGPAGRGRAAEAGVTPDVLVGTLGKALGLQGAFVSGRRELRDWLWNRARSFVFSTGMSPALCELAASRVQEVARDDAARARLVAVTRELRAGLAELGAPIAPSFGPILPWLVGAAGDAVRLARALEARGVFVQAIRPPTVPEGTARLRIGLHAELEPRDVARALGAFAALLAPRP
ncbi:MAG: 8-amino-7-oxononanoate synthase [Myxococcales bacterium]|nr:8-amino-7-oxononanoate synthase [Myxococcales bacterium]